MIINFLSGVLKRALPTKGLQIREQKKKTPRRTPVSISVDPNPAR
jgi:hypothetical protein